MRTLPIPLVLVSSVMAQDSVTPAPEKLREQILATLRQRIELAEKAVEEHETLEQEARELASAGDALERHRAVDAHLRSRARVLGLRQELKETEARLEGQKPDARAMQELIAGRMEVAEERVRVWQRRLKTLEALYDAGRAGSDDLTRTRLEIIRIKDHGLELRQQALEVELSAAERKR